MNDKIYIKEIIDNYMCKPVDWTLDKKEADKTIGEFYEYELGAGVDYILDHFVDFDFLSCTRFFEVFHDDLMKYCEENELDYRNVDIENFKHDEELHAYFIYHSQGEACVWSFDAFEDVAEWDIEHYLKDILDLDSDEVESELDWFLNINDYGESKYLSDVVRDYDDVRLILQNNQHWICCTDIEGWHLFG